MAAPASGDAAPEGKFIPFSPIRPFVPRIPRRARRPEASKPREPADARPYALGRGWTKESFRAPQPDAGPQPGPRLGGLDIAGLAHRPDVARAIAVRRARGRARRGARDSAELKPPRKALFLDLLSFTGHIGTTRHFRVPGGRGGLSIPPSSFLKGGHMHRR
ncbi:hypothetical protein JL721_12470 [Aureococcus anophagefferens]|nr:hypothetical protein JL721_12470 [Aureococcus anophagefferens]